MWVALILAGGTAPIKLGVSALELFSRAWLLFLGGPRWWVRPDPSVCALIAAPGTGGLKFNIQKRPFAVTSQNFASTSEGQHSSFGPQPNPEKAQNHRYQRMPTPTSQSLQSGHHRSCRSCSPSLGSLQKWRGPLGLQRFEC